MKNSLLLMAFFVILFSGCATNTSKNADTHTHEDGTEHENHKHSEISPEQELFEVEIDSMAVENDSLKTEQNTEHTHAGGHKHKH